jgi:hypothetical protein
MSRCREGPGTGFVAGYIKARINITRGAFTPLIEDQNPSPICYLAMGRDVPSVDQMASCELVRSIEGPGSSRTDQLGEQLKLLLCVWKAHFVFFKAVNQADDDAFLSGGPATIRGGTGRRQTTNPREERDALPLWRVARCALPRCDSPPRALLPDSLYPQYYFPENSAPRPVLTK